MQDIWEKAEQSYISPGVILLLAMMLTIPAIIFWFTFQEYIDNVKREQAHEYLIRARLVMAEAQAELSLENVVQDSFDKVSRDLQLLLHKHFNDLELVDKGNSVFFRSFSRRSRLIWFDRSFTIKAAPGVEEIANKRVWQSFARCVFSPSTAGKIDKKLADGFIRSYISDFLDVSFFAEQRERAREIVYQGRRHFIAFIELNRKKNGGDPVYVIAMVPSFGTRKNWLQQRSIRIASSKGALIGGYFINDRQIVEGSSISENFLHGAYVDFSSGIVSRMQNGVFYYYQTSFSDPDLFLAAGIEESSENINWVLLIQFIQLLFFTPSILLVLAVFWRRKIAIPQLSLQNRFRFTTLSLTLIPLALSMVLGAIYAARISLEEKQKGFQNLEARLSEVEETVSEKVKGFEAFLSQQLPADLIGQKAGSDLAEDIFKRLKDHGCQAVTLFKPDGQSFVKTDLPFDKVKPRISYQLSFVKIQLAADGFDIARLQEAFPSPSNSFDVDELRHDGPNYRLGMLDRILRIEMGGKLYSSFSTYIRGENGEILACLNLGIDFRDMRQNFLREAVAALQTDSTRLYLSANVDGCINDLPSVKSLKDVLRVSHLSGESFEFDYHWKNLKYLIISRPLKDLENSAMLVWRRNLSGLTPEKEQTLLLFLVFLASLAMVAFVVKFFDALFLRPVLELADHAKAVESGKYEILQFKSSANELGVLNANLNLMIGGLKEKAAMKSFLRRDLVADVESQKTVEAKRTETTIMFAGIRKFSLLEEKLTPEETMATMNAFLAICEEIISQNGGEVDKYIGETAMSNFSEHSAGLSSHLRAVNAACLIIDKVRDTALLSNLRFGIGIATGEVIAGHIGSIKKRLDYTFIGDTVNLAARLEKMAGTDDNPPIIVAVSEKNPISKGFSVFDMPSVKVKGKSMAIKIQGIVRQ